MEIQMDKIPQISNELKLKSDPKLKDPILKLFSGVDEILADPSSGEVALLEPINPLVIDRTTRANEVLPEPKFEVGRVSRMAVRETGPTLSFNTKNGPSISRTNPGILT